MRGIRFLTSPGQPTLELPRPPLQSEVLTPVPSVALPSPRPATVTLPRPDSRGSR